jgi:hypothetical protein
MIALSTDYVVNPPPPLFAVSLCSYFTVSYELLKWRLMEKVLKVTVYFIAESSVRNVISVVDSHLIIIELIAGNQNIAFTWSPHCAGGGGHAVA